MVAVDDALPLPSFRWDRYADMNEPPDGLTFFARLRLLEGERRTISLMSACIVKGGWPDPTL